jgi:hypothetical protein
MFDPVLPDEIKRMLIDRFEGYEIVEFLDLSADEVVDAFAEIIMDRLGEVKAELGLETDETDGTDYN